MEKPTAKDSGTNRFCAAPVMKKAGVNTARMHSIAMKRGTVVSDVAALAVLSVISVAVAQSRRPQPPAIEQATRALNEGHYDRVAGLLEKLDAQDPTVVALIARAEKVATPALRNTLVRLGRILPAFHGHTLKNGLSSARLD